jgi:hypothetical protein
MVGFMVMLFVVAVAGSRRYCVGDTRFVNNARADAALLQVQLVTRHGDRAPLHSSLWPNDTVVWNCSASGLAMATALDSTKPRRFVVRRKSERLSSHIRGTCAVGQLTVVGAEQHRRLGEAFRALYVDRLKLLRSHLDPVQVRVRSTDR